jgi:outer membrane lipoprotein SlyB
MKKIALAIACTAFSALSPAQNNNPDAVPSGEISSAIYGQVISRTALFQQVAVPSQSCTSAPVQVQGPKSGAGAFMGAIAGAAVGSQIGGGQGQALATMAGLVGGAILGALAGDAVEDRVGKKDGLEITVRLDNGETRVIAQEADVPLLLNQRVQVVSGAGPTRVTPMSGQ